MKVFVWLPCFFTLYKEVHIFLRLIMTQNFRTRKFVCVPSHNYYL